jgi:hypothetical protein
MADYATLIRPTGSAAEGIRRSQHRRVRAVVRRRRAAAADAGLCQSEAVIRHDKFKPPLPLQFLQRVGWVERSDTHPTRWPKATVLVVRRLRAKADISRPTIPAEIVENDPMRT